MRLLVGALATAAMLTTGVAVAQNPHWPVGTHAKVYYALPGGRGMAWRTGVVVEAFPWGVHFRFDDENRTETFGNDDLQPLSGAPSTSQPRVSSSRVPAAAAPAARGGNATNGRGEYRVGYGAGVRFSNQPAAGAPASRLVSNRYNCTVFIGTPPNGHMSATPGFTISGNSYRHQDGSSGTVTTVGGRLEFHGGALDGQAATYDAGATGRGTVHIFNASRSRTVIDCDGG